MMMNIIWARAEEARGYKLSREGCETGWRQRVADCFGVGEARYMPCLPTQWNAPPRPSKSSAHSRCSSSCDLGGSAQARPIDERFANAK